MPLSIEFLICLLYILAATIIINNTMDTTVLDFPLWLRITHFINLFCITLLIRSGIQILADHPKLYWNDDTTPGSEWIKFTKKVMPKGKLWTSMDEAEGINSIIALPGGFHNLGSGRRWHFLTASVWVLNGFVYVSLLFLTGQWRRIIPTSLSVFPGAWHTFLTYISLHVPPASEFHPYDPLQQLSYMMIVFVLAPFMIATGLAMSPAIAARFPWYIKLFHGRQSARSLHFLGFVGMIVFSVIHMTLIAIVHPVTNFQNMVLGSPNANFEQALMIALLALLFVILFNAWATWFTLKYPRKLQEAVDPVLNFITGTLLGHAISHQAYTRKDISPYFRVNGRPPTVVEYQDHMKDNFVRWKLKINGLLEKPLELSLDELHKLPKSEQITKHNCIQGWSAVAEWGGVHLREILKLARPLKNAKYIVFVAYDEDPDGIAYHEIFSLHEVKKPQTILAYEMNYQTLPIVHGAPIRLRIETKLGYKMVKYIKEIRFIEKISDYGEGHAGYKEDRQFFEKIAAI